MEVWSGWGGAWGCAGVDRQPSKCSGVIRSWRILGAGRGVGRGGGMVKRWDTQPEDGCGETGEGIV